MSSPSVVVVDNQPALLKVGDEVPISTQQTTAIENPNAPIVSSIQFRVHRRDPEGHPARQLQRPGDHGYRAGDQRRRLPGARRP